MFVMDFRTLSDEETRAWQAHAQEHDPANYGEWPIYHPVCREVWAARGKYPPQPTLIGAMRVYNHTPWTADEITTFPHLGNTVSNWRQRIIKLRHRAEETDGGRIP